MTLEAKITPQLRFEIFKRDEFTCQCCGKATPHVVLYVGYKVPVEKGGTNDENNLETRCYDCSEQKPLEHLSERREQLEMMIEWKKGWRTYKSDCLDLVIEYIHSKMPGYSLKEKAKKEVAKALNKYTVAKVLDTIDDAAEKTLKYDGNDELIRDSVEAYILNIHKFLYVDSQPVIRQKMFYVCGICKNRFNYWNREKGMQILETYVDALKRHGYNEGMLIKDMDDEVMPMTKKSKNWSEWSGILEDWTDQINSWKQDENKPSEEKIHASEEMLIRNDTIDEENLQAGIEVLTRLYRMGHLYTTESDYSIEYSIRDILCLFLDEELELYEEKESIPDANDKSLIEKFVDDMNFYNFFSNDWDVDDEEGKLTNNAEFFMAEEYGPMILRGMLELFFYPSSRYDYASSIAAIKLARKSIGDSMLPY